MTISLIPITLKYDEYENNKKKQQGWAQVSYALTMHTLVLYYTVLVTAVRLHRNNAAVMETLMLNE